MRRQGRAMKGELERGVDEALAVGSTTALVWLAFVAVIREGLETVLFLFAIGAVGRRHRAVCSSPPLAGLAVAVAIGYAIFALGIRIDLRRFFTITGVVLIFVVGRARRASPSTSSPRPACCPATQSCSTSAAVLPEIAACSAPSSPACSATARPDRRWSSIGYLAYLIPVLILFVWSADAPTPRRRRRPRREPPEARAGRGHVASERQDRVHLRDDAVEPEHVDQPEHEAEQPGHQPDRDVDPLARLAGDEADRAEQRRSRSSR